MTAGKDTDNTDQDIKLPFDIGTVLAAVKSRIPVMIIITVAAAGVGAAAGMLKGAKEYSAETVMKYTPAGGAHSQDYIMGELNQVKLPENVAELRERLKIGAKLEKVGASVKVNIAQGGLLMGIEGRWGDPEITASISRVMTDIYLERWLKSQRDSVEILHTKAAAELATMDEQVAKLSSVIDDLKARVQEEQSSKGSGRGAATARYKHIQNALDYDIKMRSAGAELTRLEKELDRASVMASKDLISASELEKAKTAYEQQRAVTLDSDKTQGWRRELDRLASVMASDPEPTSPTLTLMQEMLQKSYDLEINRIATKKSVSDLNDALAALNKVLDKTGKDRESAGKLLMAEGGALPKMLSRTAAIYGEGSGGVWEIVSFARPPVSSIKSTRRLVAIGAGVVFWLAGILITIGLQIFKPVMRSAAEVRQKLDLPVYGTIPDSKNLVGTVPMGDRRNEAAEAARLMIGQIRVIWPKKGMILAVTSTENGAGRTGICALMAAALGQRQEKVLIVDAETREPRGHARLNLLATAAHQQEEPDGLTELIRNSLLAEQLIVKTKLPNVDYLPRGTAVSNPELLGSKEMQRFLRDMAARYDFVIVRAAPILPWADAGILARNCDAVLMVIRAGVTRTGIARKAMKHLSNVGVQIGGTVITAVDRRFMNLD